MSDNDLMGKWSVRGSRLSGFILPEVSFEKSDLKSWWKGISGLDYDQVVEDSSGKIEITGRIENPLNATLKIQHQFNKVDLQILPPQRQTLDISLMKRFVLGDFPNTYDRIFDFLSTKLNFLPKINRLAIGSLLFYPLPTQFETYKKLDEFIDEVDLKPEFEDFLFQINKKTQSQVITELEINRLEKWASMRIQAEQMDNAQVINEDTIHTCKLEIDVNTDANRTEELEDKSIENLFDELKRLGREIVSTGGEL